MSQSSYNSRVIRADSQAVYRAFTDPLVLVLWLAPDDMTAKVHSFELRVGGGYEMSLYYQDDALDLGKTSEHEDRFVSRFVELSPPHRIVQVIEFHSDKPDFSGEMIMDVSLQPHSAGTLVTIVFKQIPPGIRPEDNQAGTELSLQKLASYLESGIH